MPVSDFIPREAWAANTRNCMPTRFFQNDGPIQSQNVLFLRLPEEQSKVVFARLEGKSYKEIAQELGVPVNRVYYLNHSAIKSLRRFYLGEPDSDSKGGS